MRAALTAVLCLALCACSDPPPNEEVPPPEPQAAAPAEKNTELRDAMQAPLDKAHAVEAAQEQRDAERDQALEDAGG
ncbi:hypothetical protein K3217_25955 [bacterium BD-1]|uniref:hypothetical protein n=1 Tax=Arenimonas sp. TaxID=1872635 RepID=UPI001E37276C|nr:hypothetical protein [Ottowia caeni]